ncbi:hypothetical protein [Streptomyces hokutonensis]|uniref:hypothetical protein n=1 Tax=Streptomyces hokutonensis TaxID=1306990 RepID=UPI003824F63B
MDTLNETNVAVLVLAAVLVAMACVKADRIRAWREGVNPSAPAVPDGAFVLARVVLLSIASAGVYSAVQGFGVADDLSWSESELTSAVRGATDDLDGFAYQVDPLGAPLAFDDYASLIVDKVTENGGGEAPATGVHAEPSDADTDADAHLTVTANGVDKAFCAHVVRDRSKKDDDTPPGAAGAGGTLTLAGYRLTVTTREGAC